MWPTFAAWLRDKTLAAEEAERLGLVFRLKTRVVPRRLGVAVGADNDILPGTQTIETASISNVNGSEMFVEWGVGEV